MAETTLPQRMREAAKTLRELNSLYSFQQEYGLWSARALEHEAAVLESETPHA